jgi:DNA repair exonuclease SbcCD nuclease subunit
MEEAAFIIAAGDVFDTKSIHSMTLWRVTQILAELKESGIKFFVIEGNHDKAFYFEKESWLYYLNNMQLLILLKPEILESGLSLTPYNGMSGAVFETDEYRIIGLGYFGALTKKRLDEAYEQIEKKEKYTIIMLHAALQYQMGEEMAGVELAAMTRFADVADYIALGHIHRRYEAQSALYNPGSLEYVDSGEARRKDQKGFYIVELPTGEKEFRPVNTRQHIFTQVDLSGIILKEEAWEKVFNAIEQTKEFSRPVIEVDLYGETLLELYMLDTARLEEEIMHRYGAVSASVTNLQINDQELHDQGESVIDRRQLEKNVMRQVMKDAGYEDALAEQLSDFALGIKESVNNNFNAEEIADMAEELAGWKEVGTYDH